MRAGIIQSCYLPWRGYFDFIASVDVFVIYDDVQYTRRSWRNRNRVKTNHGLSWITVPVVVHGKPAIDEVQIADIDKSWRDRHRELLTQSLGRAPYFRDCLDLWLEGTAGDNKSLSLMNTALLRSICQYLGIKTTLLNSRDYQASGHGTSRMIELLSKLGATCYLSGPSASDYLDEAEFARQGIRLEYKSYDYAPYPQQWGDFVDGVTILDLIASQGSNAAAFLRSRIPDVVAVP